MATEAAQVPRNLKRLRRTEGKLHIDTQSTYRWDSACKEVGRKVLLLDRRDRQRVDVPVKDVTVVSASEEENGEALTSTATPVTEAGAGQDLEDAELDDAYAQDDLSAAEEPGNLSEESDWVESESDQDSEESWHPTQKRKKRRSKTGAGTCIKSWRLRCGKSFQSLVQAAGSLANFSSSSPYACCWPCFGNPSDCYGCQHYISILLLLSV